MKYILASSSPRRRDLIQLLGLPWQIIGAEVDESSVHHTDPAMDVIQTAHLKALTVVEMAPLEAVIVAADTTVDLEGRRLNKPADLNHARQMLRSLRGRIHQVHTGIVVANKVTGITVADVASIDVPFRNFTDDELEAYLASQDPIDKAGGYNIQHAGFHPVEHFAGCFAGVMGLPLCHLTRALTQAGVQIDADIASLCQSTLDYDCPVFANILAG
jgi:septum formation protein